MRTNLTKESVLRSAQGLNLPILIAAYWYSQHSGLNFGIDLNHYLHEGYVSSTPEAFIMGKLVQLDGETVFFVRFASGNLEEIEKLTRYIEGIKWIAFCRNNDGNVRKYPIDRCKELSRIAPLTSPIFSMHEQLENSRFRSAA